MSNILKFHCLTLVGIFLSQLIFTQTETKKASIGDLHEPIISGVHTLSVHTRDTLSQDSVYLFFANKLGLPVYYTPVVYSHRKYSGIYAGNMVLEPCGPYQNIKYASEDFRAIFFGINFEVYNSLALYEKTLNKHSIKHQVNNGSIYIRDSMLCNENIFTALYEVVDKKKRDSLRNRLVTKVKNGPGIEYVKEISVGWKEEEYLTRWKEYLYPLEFGANDVCQINDSLQIRFVRGEINEVKGIIFKVPSLAEAIQHLEKWGLFGSESGKGIKLDQTRTFGLTILLSDEE